jgi:hypothetical protein
VQAMSENIPIIINIVPGKVLLSHNFLKVNSSNYSGEMDKQLIVVSLDFLNLPLV